MTDTDLVALPQDTVTLLKRRQVVASMCSAVKELVENSRCQLANLTIVSRTEAELAATRTVFREDGAVETRTSCAGMPGITVTADNLFCRLPVRRNY